MSDHDDPFTSLRRRAEAERAERSAPANLSPEAVAHLKKGWPPEDVEGFLAGLGDLLGAYFSGDEEWEEEDVHEVVKRAYWLRKVYGEEHK